MKYLNNKLKIGLLALFAAPLNLFAAAPKVSELTNPTAQILLGVVVALAICIILLAYVVLSAAQLHLKKIKQDKSSTSTKVFTTLAFLVISTGAFAADGGNTTSEVSDTIAGIKAASFYALISAIVVEITILFFLIANLRFLLKSEKAALEVTNADGVVVEQESKWEKWWDKVNSFRPIKEEAQIDLGHNYDGIRELDNKLPGWWLYGFYTCIIFACIYLWRFHVSHTGLSSKEELQVALAKGEKEKEEYLKTAANNVDEKTVKYLDAEADLAAGKALFTQNCVACHGDNASGLVGGNPGTGPNLTDDYWIHKGSINDIFYTIKYGWPDKGMKSWKEDFSPMKIAQLASYIKSMHGKNAKGKDPQGELFSESGNTAADTTKSNATVDTTKAVK